MSRFQIIVEQNRLQLHIAERTAKAAFPKARWLAVRRDELPTTRFARFEHALNDVSAAQSEAEELRDELQAWLDNLPENLQGGDKADQLQTAIDALEEFIGGCEQASGVEVEFPTMMG
jgi:hypothetical protein